MDFNDTPAEAEFRAEARAWLEANAKLLEPGQTPPGTPERDDPATVKAAQEWQAKKSDAGWAVLTWPKEHGGRAASSIQNVIWRQEQSKFRTPPDIFAIGLGMLGPTIMEHGTAEQQERYLRKMARGDEIWCQLFSEPAAGSDLAGLRATAVRDGNDWILNGQKIWTTGAHYSEWGMIVTRSDASVPKHAGLTYFIVDMRAPGVEVRPIKQISGATGFNDVFFNDVRVPDEYRLSAVGNGWAVAITTLMHERASIGGGAGGAGVNELMRLAQQTQLEGRPAWEDTSVRQRLADFYVRAKGLQYTGYRTLTSLSRGETPGPQNSLGKLVGAAMRQQMAAFAIELQALSGALLDRDQSEAEAAWQNAYLGSPGARLAGGTDEIMRNIIAERVLGMPAEARADKGLAFRDIPAGPPAKP